MAGELARRLSYDGGCGDSDCVLCRADHQAAMERYVKPVLKVSEADIEKAVDDLLQYDGWRSFKMEQVYSEKKRRTFGEAGMPDRLYLRYEGYVRYAEKNSQLLAMSEVLWIEHKRHKGIASAAQKLWHAAERKRGALTLIAGLDFPASIEGFISWYAQSGLKRR